MQFLAVPSLTIPKSVFSIRGGDSFGFLLFASHTSTIPDLLADMAEFALKNYVCFLQLCEILSLKNSA